MRVKSIESGHAKLVFQGYYTAVLTLAEAPEVQADPSPQPGHPQQAGPDPGPPQQQPGPTPGPPQQQQGHPHQGQPGPAEPMAIDDHQADEVTSGSVKVVSQDDKVGPHKEKYRWRLLSFEILPGDPIVFQHSLLVLPSTVRQALTIQSMCVESHGGSSGESTDNNKGSKGVCRMIV